MKKVVFAIIIISSVFISNNLIQSIYSLWQKKNLVITAQQNVEREQEENQQLKAQLSYVQTPQFIEEQARDRLLLAKPQEQEILLPKAASEASGLVLGGKSQKPAEIHLKEWIDLFF